VTLWVACEPTVTLPKLRLAGVAARVPAAAAVPVPLNAICSGEFEASLSREKLPLTAVADGGANSS